MASQQGAAKRPSDDDDGSGLIEESSMVQDMLGRAISAGALLERCDNPDAAEPEQPLPSTPSTVSPGAASKEEEESEGVFEIRDFTTASSFERIAHQISLAAKKWATLLRTGTDADDDGQLMREEFLHMNFTYELYFQLIKSPDTGIPAIGSGSGGAYNSSTAKVHQQERLGLHTFPSRAHRMQRWFGVQHFVILSVRGQEIDIDSARTVLSALVLGAKSVTPSFSPPISCFVPVEGGRRRRYLGELVGGNWRTLFSTDKANRVDQSMEHLSGLLEFFWAKFAANPQDADENLTIGARFTYLADMFEPLALDSLDSRGDVHTSAPAGKVPSSGNTDARSNGVPNSGEEMDPVESVQLHCLWPSFPLGSFVDNAVYSELDPRAAPYWKIRVLKRDELQLPLVKRLRSLLDFRNEAATVRSAEHSVQPQMPKTALASLSYAIQESLESILLPSTGEMLELTDQCLSCPVVAPPPAAGPPLSAPALARLKAASRGSRFAKLCELCAKMRCFKGAVMLWCQVMAQMRQLWDVLQPLSEGMQIPKTYREPERGVRAEIFDMSSCLIQQKFEMLQVCVEAQLKLGKPRKTAPTQLVLQGTGEPLLAPPLLQPALLTEDMRMQRDMIADGIADLVERAELHGREMRSDMAAFKAANPHAELVDFVAWRSSVEGLSSEPFPPTWFERTWANVVPQPATEQSTQLFEPEKEAEMALHYLENIEGTQLLLQLFRVVLHVTLEELSDAVISGWPGHLCHLHEVAVTSVLDAFGCSEDNNTGPAQGDAVAAATGQSSGFPDDEKLEVMLAALEDLEVAARVCTSMRAKLPGPGEALLDELLKQGEATVTTHIQRRAIEDLFLRSRRIAQSKGREIPDGKGVFESIPLSKEFVLLLQPNTGRDKCTNPCVGVRRMYTEIRERQLQLAVARSFSIG